MAEVTAQQPQQRSPVRSGSYQQSLAKLVMESPVQVKVGDRFYSRDRLQLQELASHRPAHHNYKKENQTMLLRLYSITVIVLDVAILLFKCFAAVFEEMYALIFSAKEKSLADDVVLVTGTGHGIGRELVLQFAELGSTVVCLDINDQANEETVKMIVDKGCKNVYSYNCDVTDRNQVIDVIQRFRTDSKRDITIVVNNAGIMPCHRFTDYTPQQINTIFNVNVFAHFWILQEILPNMVKNNRGHIVALSSMAGILGLRNLVPYCASKFAVRGMMESLAEELREEGVAPDVQFTCVFPYMVDTGLCKKPRVRFPDMLAMVTPKVAAQLIIKAIRRNQLAITIPSYYMYINDIVRLFPFKVGRLIKDFLDVELEVDDESDRLGFSKRK